MRQTAANIFLFLLIGTGMTVAFWYADKQQKAAKKAKKEAEVAAKKDEPPPAKKDAPPDAPKTPDGPKTPDAPKPPDVKPTPPPAPAEAPTFIALGGEGYYNRLLLSTRGAGVQNVVVPMFLESDRLGRVAADKGEPQKLNLIPGVRRSRSLSLKTNYAPPDLTPGKQASLKDEFAEPSYTLFHYAHPDDKYPDPVLGERNWRVVSEEHPSGGDHKVVFETDLGEPFHLKVRKTFTLGPKDFHAGLKVEFERTGGAKGAGKLRYQISGPRGLPVEGEWYGSTYRVALVGWTDSKGQAKRQYEDAAALGAKRGGEAVLRADNNFKYAGVVTQYFASVLAVDDNAGVKNPWAYVRATTELPFGEQQSTKIPYFDDITVRAVSDPLDLAPGERTAHDYLIYNGPVKVRLLKMLKDGSGGAAVDPALVDRYHDYLDLRTLTDYQSPTFIGTFANKIYFADLVIACTNLMHGFLYVIHSVVPNWALCIVVLTVCVRLLLFIPSKKQTQMNLRMMEIQKRLKPEIERLQEKYKNDFNTFNREKTRLLMQNGMNPFSMMGGCLLLFAQMPIMMGLYFALQESIFFRLEPFLWMKNLAAPDMLVWWGEKIPFISDPAEIGSLLYLGPFFNIMPVLAVGLMIYQQNKMMPPPTDEQMAQQQRMMKFMMIIVAVMFYKVAAGLCLYFIVSTLWGILERQFIPKADDKPADGEGAAATPPPASGSPNGVPHEPKPLGMIGRAKARARQKLEELKRQAEEQSKRQIRNDDKDGPRPGGGGGGPGTRKPPPDRKKNNKKRRK